MDNELKLVLDLPLKEITLRRQVVFLCTEPDILSSIHKIFIRQSTSYYKNYDEKCRQIVQSRIPDKLSKRVLPESIAKKIVRIAYFIVPQIGRWILFHKKYLFGFTRERVLLSNILTKLRWTKEGVIDYPKTAVELLCCENLNIVHRYKLACLYCLDNYIPDIWKELPEHKKREFLNERALNFDTVYHLNLSICWSFILNGEQSKLDRHSRRRSGYPFNVCIFEYTARSGNKSAAEYFFRKLTPEEKEASLIKAATEALIYPISELYSYCHDFSWDNFSYILIYLLSQMNREQQIQYFEKSVTGVLLMFLEWPWHDVYFQIIEHAWACITFTDRQYIEVMIPVMNYYDEGQDEYSKNFVQEFFMRQPIAFRKHFVEKEYIFASVFYLLIKKEDSETVQVIFRNIDDADRIKLVSSPLSFVYFLEGKWDFVKVCFREVKLSKQNWKTLESAFKEFLTSDYNTCKDERACKQFLQLIQENVNEC